MEVYDGYQKVGFDFIRILSVFGRAGLPLYRGGVCPEVLWVWVLPGVPN
jgi:hypothetical protein